MPVQGGCRDKLAGERASSTNVVRREVGMKSGPYVDEVEERKEKPMHQAAIDNRPLVFIYGITSDALSPRYLGSWYASCAKLLEEMSETVMINGLSCSGVWQGRLHRNLEPSFPTPKRRNSARGLQYILTVEHPTEHPMEPFHKPTAPTAVTAPTLSLVPHSALVDDVTSASTALGKQGDSLDKCSHTSFDSTHANDSATPVWFTRIHTAVSILTSGRQRECTGRTPFSA